MHLVQAGMKTDMKIESDEDREVEGEGDGEKTC